MNLLKSSLLLASSCAAFATLGNAALVITSSDIADDKYTFSLSFADLASTTKFDTTVFAKTNVFVSSDGSGDGLRRFVRAPSNVTAASFIYKFDFSGTDYTPTSLTVTDNIFLSGGTTVKISYSTDDMANWTTIRTSSGSNTANISLNSVTGQTVYYKVEFAGPNAGTSNIPNLGAQWARTGSGGTPFIAEFTLASNIPEPANAVALIAVLAGLVIVARRVILKSS